MIITLNESRAMKERNEKKREILRDALDDLFWSNQIAYIQLCRYCEARKNKIDPEIKEELIEKGFLNSTGGLPRITNEVVYESVMGQKPFWLD